MSERNAMLDVCLCTFTHIISARTSVCACARARVSVNMLRGYGFTRSFSQRCVLNAAVYNKRAMSVSEDYHVYFIPPMLSDLSGAYRACSDNR